MFRGAARRFLSGAATKAKVRSLPLRPSRIAIVTGSLYCFYAIPTAYLDAASSDPPPSSAERHSPRADIIRKLDESRPRLNPESLIQSRITEYEYFLKMEYDGTGIVGCHVNETPSNSVSVDRTSVDHTRFGPESRSWTFFGLYDGHNGTGANLELSNRLPSLVIEVLMNLYNNFNNDFEFDTLGSNGEARMRDPPGEHIDDAIKHAFVSMDEYLVRHVPEQTLTDGASSATPRALAVWSLDSAWAGSTALLAFYDEQTRQLRMSCTGSSRAVLGRETKASNGQVKYELHTLSQDQTPDNPEEVARIKREHPQENHLFHDGRLLGIRPTRSFGDLQLKAGRTTLERIHDVLGGPPVQEHVLTPPYVTAEPVITTTDIQPGDFLIVATDGLWEWLTSAEAVGLVGVWLNQNERGVTKSGYDSPLSREALPVTKLDEDKTKMYKRWGAEKRFVNVDDNCASHLVRNALGSANVDVAAALMSSIAPRARAYRDDISVMVIFFDD